MKFNYFKVLAFLIVALSLPTLAFATHETSFNFHLQSFDLNSNGTAYLVPMDLDIFSTATCSGTPIFTSSCTTDVNGVCDISVTMNTSYNQIMYACIYANNTLLSGSPSQFRAGFGQVTDGDVSFTNLTADNFFGNFIGDGSLLTNLPTQQQFWNRTGTTLSPATLNDDVFVTGDLYVGAYDKICLDVDKSVCFFYNSSHGFIDGSNNALSLASLTTSNVGFIDGMGNFGIISYTGTHLSMDDVEANALILWDDLQLQHNNFLKFSDTFAGTKTLTYNGTNNRFEFNDNVSAPYFIGDGSQLTNLPVGTSYWNRTGTTLEPATLGDDVNLTGILYIADDNAIVFGQEGNITADYSVNGAIEINSIQTNFISNGMGTVYMDGFLAVDKDLSVYKELKLLQNQFLSFNNTKTLTYNSTSARFEFNDTVYAPDFVTDAKQLDVEFIPRFLLTGGGATATVGIDTVNDRRIYSRFSFGGGTVTHTGYHRFELDPLIDSWNTTNSIKVWIRSNTVTGVTFSANLYYGNTLDGAVNGTQTKQVTATNTWEQWQLQPSTTPTPNQITNLEVICTSTVNGANCDLADIEIYYLRDKI